MIKTPLKKPIRIESFMFFLSGLFFAGIISTALQGTFQNYLNDIFGIGAQARGALEFPRELPGLLITFIIGSILFIGEINILSISVVIAGFGLLGLGYFSHTYESMIIFMMIWSLGTHLHMTIVEPVALTYAHNKNRGFILGRMNSVRSIGIIAGTFSIWLFMGKLHVHYRTLYLGAFITSIIAGILYALQKRKKTKAPALKFKFIFRKKYTRFYILAALFGVRKQLFLVFGPWLLIKMYHREAADLALLLFIAAVIGVFFKPYLGTLIDRFGERKVLMADAVLIITLSSVYAVSPLIFSPSIALPVLSACFITDELLFSLRTARTTYISKNLEKESDLTPTLAMGISIEHVISMTAPLGAGFLWAKYGYYWVFIIAAFVAVFSGITASGIKEHGRLPKQQRPPESQK